MYELEVMEMENLDGGGNALACGGMIAVATVAAMGGCWFCVGFLAAMALSEDGPC